MPRRTLAGPVSVRGVGLHTGAATTVELLPAAAGRGIVLERTDCDPALRVSARVGSVRATERRTSLGARGGDVETVEHLLAVIGALQIDDLLIRLDGPEPPMLDGSFAPWLEAIEGAGVIEVDGEPAVVHVRESFAVTAGAARYLVEPDAVFRISATIEWPHPMIGQQSLSVAITPESFRTEIAPARTFGFVHEVEALRARGLLQGATSEMAVVLSATGIESGTLRWPDEFVRHKIGDVVGDLALLGARVEAHIMAERPSHKGNVAVAQEIARRAERSDPTGLDINRIMEVIPHRYPFLLVDRIIEIDREANRIVGLKNVTINEPFFQGHFPGHPIMPGVLIVEAMAQVGGMLLMDHFEGAESKVVYFMAIDGVKFRKPVLPGDQLRLELEMIQFRGRTCKMRGVALVEGQAVCEAEMMARVVDR
jgi:UDP-3-O-[3-hydroxymyristoyl] N-acetylglucosamine deacetylase/3-hydroxyacyl-[acyl-carrier-protein] dehydratase